MRTVSFTDEVAYCHRCHWTANLAQLSWDCGIRVPVPTETREQSQARTTVANFQRWLSKRYGEAAKQEYHMARQAKLAGEVLARFPDEESAWDALARWFHKRRSLEAFFELAQCRSGRIELFKLWVSHV